MRIEKPLYTDSSEDITAKPENEKQKTREYGDNPAVKKGFTERLVSSIMSKQNGKNEDKQQKSPENSKNKQRVVKEKPLLTHRPTSSDDEEYEYVDISEISGPIINRIKGILSEYRIMFLVAGCFLIAWVVLVFGRNIGSIFVIIAFAALAAIALLALFSAWRTKKEKEEIYLRGREIYNIIIDNQVGANDDADSENGSAAEQATRDKENENGKQ